MKRLNLLWILLFSFILLNCGEEVKEDITLAEKDGVHKVTVLDKMDASDYTYLEVKEENTKYWIAVRKMEIQKDEVLYFSKKMPMKNFKSSTLNRTFANIYFVEDAAKNQVEESGKMPNPHSQIEAAPQQNIKVTKAEGGYTVQEIYSGKDQLNGKTVKIRGIVVKLNTDILNKNWVHIQDGTGTGSTFDLVLTTKDAPEVGKTIVAEGKLARDVDFGSGYKYAVLVQDASIKIE